MSRFSSPPPSGILPREGNRLTKFSQDRSPSPPHPVPQYYRSRSSLGERVGWRGAAGGELVGADLVLNAERSSQCRLSPCTRSSALTTARVMALSMLVFAWTWLLRLLVRLARLSSERPRFSARTARFVLTPLIAPLAFPSTSPSCCLPRTGNRRSPSAPG